MREVETLVVGPRADCERALAGRPHVKIASSAALPDAARASSAELLWILDAGARPSERTLAALLESGRDPAASLPVDGAGRPVEEAIGRFVENDAELLLRMAAERCVPLRHTTLTSLLAERLLVADEPPPDPRRFGAHAASEWTARLFARSPGVLVPASTVEVGRPAPGSPAEAMRAARAAGWGKGESLRALQRSLAR